MTTQRRTVMIYQKPLTEQGPEGEAELVRALDREHNTDPDLELWEVRFPGDSRVVRRVIRKGGE